MSSSATNGQKGFETRPLSGSIASVTSEAITFGQVAIGPDGPEVDRLAVLRQGEDGMAWDVMEPASVADALAEAAGRSGFGRRLDVVGLPDCWFGLGLTLLPPVNGPALRALAGRRLRELMDPRDEDMLVDVSMTPGDGAAPDESLPAFLAWCVAEPVRAFDRQARRRGLRLGRALAPSAALLSLPAADGDESDDVVSLLVHVSFPAVVLAVFRNGVPVYVRHLVDALQGATGDVINVTLTEIRRTAAFFRENHRGRAVDVIQHLGLPETLVRDFEHAARELVATVTPLTAGVREVSGEARVADAVPLVALLSSGAVRESSAVAPVDFLPSSSGRGRWLAVAAGVLMLALGIGTISWRQAHAAVTDRRSELAVLEERWAGVELGVELREASLEVLSEEERWHKTLEQAGLLEDNPINPLLQLVAEVPEAWSVDDLTFNAPFGRGPSAVVWVSSRDSSPDGMEALVQRMAALPWCQDVRSAMLEDLLISGWSADDDSRERDDAEVHVLEVAL